MTMFRGSRSAKTPPMRRKTTCGIGAGGEHEAEVGLRTGQVEHRERERDRRHRVAEEGDRPACEEQAELALGERA